MKEHEFLGNPLTTAAAARTEREALLEVILEAVEEWEADPGPKASAYTVVLRAYKKHTGET